MGLSRFKANHIPPSVIQTGNSPRLAAKTVLKLSTRVIKYWDLTEDPTKESVRQRFIDAKDQDPGGKFLIHDNALQFTSINYPAYGIDGVCTSVAAPNMKTEESESNGQVYLGIAELTMVAAQANVYVE